MSNEEDGGLKQTHKVVADDSKYTHYIEVEYPLVNVKNMKDSWSETVEDINAWLEEFDSNVEKTIEYGVQSFETELNEKAKRFEGFELLSDVEKLARMKEVFVAEKQLYEDMVARKEELLVEARQSIVEEFSKTKAEVEKKRSQLLDALNLWNNPQVK